MNTQNPHVKELIKILAYAAIAGVVGVVFFCIQGVPMDITLLLLIFWICAGIPSGWRILTKLLGNWVALGFYGLLMTFFLKVCFGMLVGMVAFPIQVICCVVKIVRKTRTMLHR